MPLDIEAVTKDLDWLSDRISGLLRTAAAGIVVLVWGLLVAGPAKLALNRGWLIAVGLTAILAMLLDLAQYAFGYANSDRYRRRLERGEKIGGYNPNDFLYKCRGRCFWLKLVVVGVAFVALLVLLLVSFFAKVDETPLHM